MRKSLRGVASLLVVTMTLNPFRSVSKGVGLTVLLALLVTLLGSLCYGQSDVPEATSGFQVPIVENPNNRGNGFSASHPGVDLNGPGGSWDDNDDPVFATANGKVVYTSTATWGGVVIKHNYKGTVVYSQYGHVDKIFVSVGQNVSKGDPIAEIGNVTPSTSPHLHFEIRKSNHPNPTRGDYWTTGSSVFNWYEDPLWWVSNHGPYDDAVGQKQDGSIDQRFGDCYTRVNKAAGSNWVGQPYDNGGGLYVHTAPWVNNGVGLIQDFNGGTGGQEAILAKGMDDKVGTAYHLQGEFWNKFLSLGGCNSVLGWPKGDRSAAGRSPFGSDGAYQNFENGQIYSKYRANGQDVFEMHGPTAVKYNQLGGTNSSLGFPASDELPAGIASEAGIHGWCTSGRYQNFEGGQIYYCANSPRAGWAFEVHGDIATKYNQLGGTTNPHLGFPTDDERDADPPPWGTTGQVSRFEGGSIYSSKYGTYEVWGIIGHIFEDSGGTKG